MNVLLFCQYLPGGFLLFLPGPSLSLCLTCIELWALEQQGLQERAVEPRLCGGQGPVPEALGAPLRRFCLPGGGGQRGLHLGCREFVKQCVRETGLPPDTRSGMEPEAWSCEKEQEWRPGWDLNSWPGLWPGACGDQRHESRLAFPARGSSTWGTAAASLGRSS